jgi:hypothetical protein
MNKSRAEPKKTGKKNTSGLHSLWIDIFCCCLLLLFQHCRCKSLRKLHFSFLQEVGNFNDRRERHRFGTPRHYPAIHVTSPVNCPLLSDNWRRNFPRGQLPRSWRPRGSARMGEGMNGRRLFPRPLWIWKKDREDKWGGGRSQSSV